MKRFFPILHFLLPTLCLVAAVYLYWGIRNLHQLPAASTYQDKGICTFYPKKVYPTQEKRYSGRHRSTRSTRTVYILYYQSKHGYQYRMKVAAESVGKKMIWENEPIQRRVLRIDSYTYITVEPDQTPESYVTGLRRTYIIQISVSALYMAGYLLFVVIRWNRRDL